MDTSAWIVLGGLGVILIAFIYLVPTFIAFRRNHSFKWIIFGINLVLGASGIGWLIAFSWAIWPQHKSLADPLLGNPTGTGSRNIGNTMGEIRASSAESKPQNAGASTTESALDAIDKLGALAAKGVITPEEFSKKKTTLLSRV